MSEKELLAFFRDAARQVLAAYHQGDPRSLRGTIGYLSRCLENGELDTQCRTGEQ